MLAIFISTSFAADDATARYFEQLRQRGLFGLAESEAASRIAAADDDFEVQTRMSIELSRSLAEHAGFVPDAEQKELWQRACDVVESLAAKNRSLPRSALLVELSGAVFAMKADWLRGEREVRLFDDELVKEARSACDTAIERLSRLESSLKESSPESSTKKSGPTAPLSGYERKAVLHRTRWLLALTYRNRAELSESSSSARRADLAEAEQIAKRLTEVADEPIQTQAKLLIVSCRRLKDEQSKAEDLLKTIGKSLPEGFDAVSDQYTAERAQLLINNHEPTEAAELLLKSRSERKRLPGQLWYLQVKALTDMREIAIGKKDDALATRLTEQIESTINRCESQVGGFWARRCRQYWENRATSQKYGERLDTLMQQARSAYTAGQIDISIEKYASAEQLAKSEAKPDIAAELGFTLGSILLEQGRYQSASTTFGQVVSEYPQQPRAAKANLLSAYCLGRLFDSERTDERLHAYEAALDHHLSQYPNDETANDAYFLKGQLSEQQSHPDLAMPSYLKINPKHARYAEAMAAVARCDEVILQQMLDRRQDVEKFSNDSIERLSSILSAAGDSVERWEPAHAEIALRLASISLLSAAPQLQRDRSNSSKAQKEMPSLATLCQQADQWLIRVQSYLDRTDQRSPSDDIKQQLVARFTPLKMIALAGQGKLAEAQALLTKWKPTTADRLSVLMRLNQLTAESNPEHRLSLNVLQQKIADELISQRNDLSPSDQLQLDLTLFQIYRSSNEQAKAMEVARHLMAKNAKNVEIQRHLAVEFGKMDDATSWSMAKDAWRRVESLSKVGTDAWFQARIEVIKSCIRLKQIDEARKLLQVTKVLHPALGGPERKSEFESIEQQLK